MRLETIFTHVLKAANKFNLCMTLALDPLAVAGHVDESEDLRLRLLYLSARCVYR